jgi:osmotically-inducible protein OsmY
VQLELRWDARVSPNEIGVAVKDGVVTLSGTVANYSTKWSAERAALRVRGVRAVVNEIQVRLEGDDQLSDVGIAEAAARALELDSLVPDGAVKASVSGGWVTLRGEVDWDYERTEAERVVRDLVGVKGVTNLVTIRPRTGPSPDEVKKTLSAARRCGCQLRSPRAPTTRPSRPPRPRPRSARFRSGSPFRRPL